MDLTNTKYNLSLPFPWKIIVTGSKQRHCGRCFYMDSDGRWNLMFEGKRVRDIRKTKNAKQILTKEYWRYLN